MAEQTGAREGQLMSERDPRVAAAQRQETRETLRDLLDEAYDGDYEQFAADLHLVLREFSPRYAEPSAPAGLELVLPVTPDTRTWVARLTGRHPQFGYSRTFVKAARWDVDDRKVGTRTYRVVEDGVYEDKAEVRGPATYFLYENGQRRRLYSQDEVGREVDRLALREPGTGTTLGDQVEGEMPAPMGELLAKMENLGRLPED